MLISRAIINDYFRKLLSQDAIDVLSNDGFKVLADWSEQQPWWNDFVTLYNLESGWRSTCFGDPNNFALHLFKYHMTLQGNRSETTR